VRLALSPKTDVYRMITHCNENDPDAAHFYEQNEFVVHKERIIQYLKEYEVCKSKDKDDDPKFESFNRQLNKYGFNGKSFGAKKMIFSHKDRLFYANGSHDAAKIKMLDSTNKDEKCIAKKEDVESEIRRDVTSLTEKVNGLERLLFRIEKCCRAFNHGIRQAIKMRALLNVSTAPQAVHCRGQLKRRLRLL